MHLEIKKTGGLSLMSAVPVELVTRCGAITVGEVGIKHNPHLSRYPHVFSFQPNSRGAAIGFGPVSGIAISRTLETAMSDAKTVNCLLYEDDCRIAA